MRGGHSVEHKYPSIGNATTAEKKKQVGMSVEY